jgi:hypothetical protein
MKRSNLFIITIIATFIFSFGIPGIQHVPLSGLTDAVFLSVDQADAKSYGSRSSFSSSRSSSYRSSSPSRSSSGSSSWFKSSKPASSPAPKKSAFSSSAKQPTASKPGYTNTSKPAPNKSYSNSAGVTAAQTSKSAGKKSAFSTASKTGSSATALKSYQAPKPGKQGYKSPSGATFKPAYTGKDYSRNYSTIRVDNRPVWVNSSPYPGMWTTLIALETMNAIERERYMMMMRSDPRYMSFYNQALTDPNLSPAMRAQLMATNNMAYASAGRPVGSMGVGTIVLLSLLTVCVLGVVVYAVSRS